MKFVGFAVGILLLGWALRLARKLWWMPRKMEKEIREAGINGRPYSLLFGDLRKMLRLYKEAVVKPMPFSHDIAFRVLPFHSLLLKNYGKVFLSWLGTEPGIFISDPALIKEVLSNRSGHIETPKPKLPASYISVGLLGLDGDKWAAHRKIIAPAFLSDKLKRMQPAFLLCCDELIKRWDNLVGPDGSREIDVWPELQDFTRDVLSRSAFGSSSEEGKLIFQLKDEQSDLVAKSFLYFQIPGYRFLPTKMNRRLRAVDLKIRSMLKQIIVRRQNEMDRSPQESVNDDLLGVLLKSNRLEESRISTEDMVDECKLLYFAGQETTANLLTWTMIVLGRNPNWQDRARAEVLEVFGNEKPDFERLGRLKIVTMILYEVLRLYPPAPYLARKTKVETKLGEYRIPEGVNLEISILLLQHDPDYWGEDSSEFNPERFAEGVQSRAAKNKSPEMVTPFFAFGGGPRVCMGQAFAVLEGKMALASILQRFSFELSPTYIHAPYTVITLQPQHGAHVILRRL